MAQNRDRLQLNLTVDPQLKSALMRLNKASGTSISRIVEEFLNVDVLNSISEGLEMAKRGEPVSEVSSYMHSIVGRHVVAASEALGDLDKVVKEK